MRPGSSMSQRPTSAVGTSRPISSLSRPSSAASQRTTSRMSARPLSRISQRPSTRQSRALCQTLVTRLTGLVPDEDDNFEPVYDLALRRIESLAKQAISPDLQAAQAQLRRFSKKARIQGHEELADAFDIAIKRLRAETEKRADLDNEISISKLPEHLQFLFLLASQPSSSTHAFAAQLLDGAHNSSAPSALTWATILREEPFEGQHWQGAYGLPAGTVIGQEDQEESIDSSPSLSSISDSELDERDGLFIFPDYEESTDLSDHAITSPSPAAIRNQAIAQESIAEPFRIHLEVEALRRRQYWKTSWRIDAQLDRAFDLGDPSTLGPSFWSIVGTEDKGYQLKPEDERYINECDAIREVLILLQGRQSILFEQNTNKDGVVAVTVSKHAPKLLHLTPSAQDSILSTFARLATILCRLRIFLSAILQEKEDGPSQRTGSLTAEAFAEALEFQIIRFDARMAQKEESMLRAHLQNGKNVVVSLLSLGKVIREEFSNSFDELLGIVCSSFPASIWLNSGQMLARIRSSPSSFSSRLLDSLFETIQRKQSFGDTVTASTLKRVFLKTAEPVWKMLGRWLRDGIFMPETANSATEQDVLPQEFFIESNGLAVVDCDFWSYGYSLRFRSLGESSPEYSVVPIFLRSLADKILGAGKSIGLLRILGHTGNIQYGKLSAATWPSFEPFMMNLFGRGSLFDQHALDNPDVDISPDNLSLLLSDYLLPVCSNAEYALKNVLYTDCNLLHHLDAIEDLFLSRKGDIAADFCDALFSAIDSKKIWTDYHFLNTAFREIVDSRRDRRIDSNLVRLSYKSSSKNALERSVRCFDGLTVEYAAPFPLVFVIGSRASQVYNAIFVLMIKIRRAKTFLDNILLRRSVEDTLRSQEELKVFYATRSKLSWFVNTFLNFICSYVLQVETQHFRSSLRDSGSLDDIINLHQQHLDTLEKFCFLDEETAALQRALRLILDMSIVFSDCFVAFAGDTTLNTSHGSTSRRHRHKSRRQRRQRLDIVSFAPISSFRDEDSDSSDSDLDESVAQEISEDFNPTFAAPSAYESFGVEDFFDQNEKMVKDLDSRVRYIRREVERLASSTSGAQFDVLAFSLQDWDL